MKFRLAIVCLVAFTAAPALAQSGISNQRNMYGNIVRDSGPYSATGVNQGPINNGSIRRSPAQPSQTNMDPPRGAKR
jgi:hypothetical protein